MRSYNDCALRSFPRILKVFEFQSEFYEQPLYYVLLYSIIIAEDIQGDGCLN